MPAHPTLLGILTPSTTQDQDRILNPEHESSSIHPILAIDDDEDEFEDDAFLGDDEDDEELAFDEFDDEFDEDPDSESEDLDTDSDDDDEL